MPEITITIRGAPEDLMPVLRVLAETSSTAEPTEFDPDRFAEQLTEMGRSIVMEVARVSELGGSLLRRDLAKKLGVDEQVLAGVFGGIGLHWKASSSAANPFRGKWDASLGDFRYGIDRDQARQILAALKVS